MNQAPVFWIDASRCAQSQRLFGLTTLERLRRSLAQLFPAARVVVSGTGKSQLKWPGATIDPAPGALGGRLSLALRQHGSLVVLDGASVIDPRLLQYLASATDNLIARRGEAETAVVAMRLGADCADGIDAQSTSMVVLAQRTIDLRLACQVDEQAFPAYIDKLRRVLPYWLFRVDDSAARRAVERRLFLDNYKGSTDLLTAHVYPPLVWPIVRLCSVLRLHPNAVTVLSILLTIAAVPLFAKGQWLAGFACAYVMSVLDSVDGKLARLTFTDSAVGNVLDHGLDLVHPPFWYWAWAQGLIQAGGSAELAKLAALLNVFYVLDRVVLGVARRRLGHALHSTTPLDGFVRSFIARRNMTMTLMALSLLVGQGAAGLALVALWQGLTMIWHAWRTLWNGWLASGRRPGGASEQKA